MSRIPLKQVINISNWRFFIAYYKLIGLWPPVLHRRFYLFFAFLFHSFFTFLFIFTMVLNVLINQDITELYITLTELAMLGKCGLFFRRHLAFQSLSGDLFEKRIFSLKNSQEVQIYSENIRHYRIIINLYIGICMVVITMAGLSSIFSDPMALSYPAWFPFDYQSCRNVAYYAIFAYQNTGMFVHCLLNLIWDCLMPFVMVNLHSQFRILNTRLAQGFSEPENFQRTRAELLENIVHYNAIVKFKSDFQRFVSLPMAIQVSITGFVLCVTMIQLISVSPVANLAGFLLYLSYIVCMLVQLYLQCYFGSLASDASASLLNAAYSANWLDLDIRNRKLLIMFMVRLQQPSRIKTMKIVAMERSTFTQILNLSYSCFAILRKTKTVSRF